MKYKAIHTGVRYWCSPLKIKEQGVVFDSLVRYASLGPSIVRHPSGMFLVGTRDDGEKVTVQFSAIRGEYDRLLKHWETNRDLNERRAELIERATEDLEYRLANANLEGVVCGLNRAGTKIVVTFDVEEHGWKKKR